MLLETERLLLLPWVQLISQGEKEMPKATSRQSRTRYGSSRGMLLLRNISAIMGQPGSLSRIRILDAKHDLTPGEDEV